MKEPRTFKVAVFVYPGKRVWKFNSYTTYFREDWPGCNVVEVEATTGTEAKKKAIAQIRERVGDFPTVKCGVKISAN